MIGANLVGHDSHGVILLPTYEGRFKKGHIVPGARFEVVREGPSTARINGHWGFGQVVSERAMQLAIEKAKRTRSPPSPFSTKATSGGSPIIP